MAKPRYWLNLTASGPVIKESNRYLKNNVGIEMEKAILLVTLVFTLSCSFAAESSQPGTPVIAYNPGGIPVVVSNPIRLDYSGKIVAHVKSNTEHDGFVIPIGTKLVFYYKAKTKDAALPVVNVDFMHGRVPDGRPLVLYGQKSIEVSLVFTNPDYLVDEEKEIKAASTANVVFLEGGCLKPISPPTPGD